MLHVVANLPVVVLFGAELLCGLKADATISEVRYLSAPFLSKFLPELLGVESRW